MTEKEEQVVGTLFSDCPDRDHDPYRMAGKPCHLCAAKEAGRAWRVSTVDDIASLKAVNAELRAENERLRKRLDEYLGGHERHTEIIRLKQEISRLQEELRRLHSQE